MTQPTVQGSSDTGQQVFKPVPTHDDMQALSEKIRQSRQAQARLLVSSIFLAGIVLAAVVALVWMYSHMNSELAAAEDNATAQAAALTQLEQQLAARDETIASQQATLETYADFQSVRALQIQIDTLESEIAALLAQPSRANAPQRLKEMPAEVEWLDDVVTRLRARRDALQALKADVEAWPPAVQNPRPD